MAMAIACELELVSRSTRPSGALFVAGATVTFWTIDSIEAVNMLTYGGNELISYPMHIYPRWLRRFFTFVVPAILITSAPALSLLDQPDPLGLPGWVAWCTPAVAAAASALAAIAWRFGIRHYRSTGS